MLIPGHLELCAGVVLELSLSSSVYKCSICRVLGSGSKFGSLALVFGGNGWKLARLRFGCDFGIAFGDKYQNYGIILS